MLKGSLTQTHVFQTFSLTAVLWYSLIGVACTASEVHSALPGCVLNSVPVVPHPTRSVCRSKSWLGSLRHTEP